MPTLERLNIIVKHDHSKYHESKRRENHVQRVVHDEAAYALMVLCPLQNIASHFVFKKGNWQAHQLNQTIGNKGDVYFRGTYVWLGAIGYAEPSKQVLDGVAHLYIPQPKLQANTSVNADMVLASVIAAELTSKANTIVHLNWINHLPIAFYLKQHTSCKIVLTKHCIPWRDLVTNNYSAFYPIQKAFERGKAIVLEPRLRKEQIQYDFVDHIITVTHCAKQSLVQLLEVPTNKIPW